MSKRYFWWNCNCQQNLSADNITCLGCWWPASGLRNILQVSLMCITRVWVKIPSHNSCKLWARTETYLMLVSMKLNIIAYISKITTQGWHPCKYKILKRGMLKHWSGRLYISCNKVLHNSDPHPLCVIKIILALSPNALKWLRNIWPETAPFDINNATKMTKKIRCWHF